MSTLTRPIDEQRNEWLMNSLKRGTTFVHSRLLSRDDRGEFIPAVCTVTAFRHGHVYFTTEPGTKAAHCFPYDQADRWIAELRA